MAQWWNPSKAARVRFSATAVAIILGASLASAQGSASAVPQLDAKQFVGSWFELAHLPDKKQKACIGDALTLFTLADKPFHFAQIDSCRLKDGTTDGRNYTGTTKIKKTWTGQLKVWTVWPLSRKLWILAVAPDYQWMLIGAPNHKSLAILSRTTRLPPDLMAQLTSQAAAQGFPAAKLILVPQTSRTAPAPTANAAATPE